MCQNILKRRILKLVEKKEGEALSPTAQNNNIDVNVTSLHSQDESSNEEQEQPLYKGVGYLILGGALILIFSEPFITAVVSLAALAHVNPILFAFFLAPIASEMPEILESISLSRKGRLQNLNIAVSNLLGGTITKTTFLCGIFFVLWCIQRISLGIS